ncbi:unnamed protein product [Porites lobata]|uniref:Uncharacterized protein n=1 Tax=Porites lobata TaxID=104759 RepID=A0ABN8RFK7_9CNID|nr:unnamed protein product [Porites lobata]
MENLRKDYRARVREDLLTEAASDTNKVKFFQEQFQKKDGLPVYMKGRYGIPMTRFLFWSVGIGCVITVGAMGLMATNNLPKKQR